MALVVVSAGLLLAAVVFYGLAIRACQSASRTLATAREMHEQVERGLRTQRDEIAKIEEWTA